MELLPKIVIPDGRPSVYDTESATLLELVAKLHGAMNELISETLKWEQTQEGVIQAGVQYMKDNLVATLTELLRQYEYEVVRDLMLEMYGEELEALKPLKVFVTPQMFGAKADGVTNDTVAIETAISSLSHDGGVLFFPEGTYLMTGKPVEIPKANVTFMGNGLILCDFGFRPKGSNFRAIGMRMRGYTYSQDNRAFLIENYGSPLSGFTFKDCYFRNFFYSVCAVAGSYNYDGTEAQKGYPVRDVVIENCHSDTYTDKNAGHFQMIQVENISYINNRTYGGQNASSYNAIKGNGYIRVIGNYDHNNSYASCEIENGSANAVIANNTFKSKIWVDDSSNAVISGNTTDGGISVTVGSNVGDTDNVLISGNVCKNIRCEQFGTYQGGAIKNVNITGNTVNGENTHGIWIHTNAVLSARIVNNIISGVNATNDIAVQRSGMTSVVYISGNFGNGKTLLIAGTGGKVFAIDNFNMEVSGNRDPLPVSHLERSFNGLRVTDSNGEDWRINVSTSGQITATKY